MTRPGLEPKTFIVFISALFLVWIMIKFGMGSHYGNTNSTELSSLAITWDDSHARALFNASLVEQDPVVKLDLLESSLKNNPADSRVAMVLAQLWLAHPQRREQIEQLISLAGRLRPGDVDIQFKVAAFFAENEDLNKALIVWDKVLQQSRKFDQYLFPFFYSLLKDPQRTRQMSSFILNADVWWQRFFSFMSGKDDGLQYMEAVFELRNTAKQIQAGERTILVNRLIKEAQWDRAYMLWLNGLSEKQMLQKQLLFNGGFEDDIENTGFGWQSYGSHVATLKQEYGVGVSGSKAMHIIFKGKDEPFYHLHQRIRLRPGSYQLSGKARAVSLRSLRGLKWRVSCLYPSREVLGYSGSFVGSTPWESFQAGFEVPEGCDVQELRLVIEGRNAVERRIRGELWLDALEIKQI